ncbi:MAG: F0F1 ATP synthase subunit delta [Candidatus Moraniibacteriota bacterium]
MRISERQLAEAVAELLQEKKETKELVFQNLIAFLRRKRLLRRTGKIVESLEKYLNEKEGRLPVIVTTATALSSAEQNKVEKEARMLFPGKKLMLTFREKAALLGGIRIETENTRYDATLSRSLEKLAQTL